MKQQMTAEKHIRELAKARQSAEYLQKLLLRSELQAQHSTGMRTVDRLAREMALYFKDILGSVNNYATLLDTQIGRDEEHHKYVRLILSQTEMGMAFTETLLTFGAAASINLGLLNMNRFIDEIGQFLSATIKKGVKLRTMLMEQDLTIMADPVRIGQVFVTLVRYCIRAIRPGGTVTVLTKFLPVKQTLDERDKSGCLVLSVRSADVAHPRPPAARQRRRSPGKEIELAFSAVRRIIKEHRGAIRIGGQRGRVMEFNVYLPVLARG